MRGEGFYVLRWLGLVLKHHIAIRLAVSALRAIPVIARLVSVDEDHVSVVVNHRGLSTTDVVMEHTEGRLKPP